VAFAGIDQQHLPITDLAAVGAIVEMQSALCDYQGDRDCVPVFGNVLSRLQSQADNAHRTAIGDLLET
jgi:hypothetical protein